MSAYSNMTPSDVSRFFIEQYIWLMDCRISQIRGKRNHGVSYVVMICCVIVLIMCLYEGIVAILQLSGFMHSLNSRYPFTGTFYNPGPFACFIAMCVPMCMGWLFSKRLFYSANLKGNSACTVITVLCALVFLIGIFLIPASMSRTSWLAITAGAIIALADRWMPIFRRHKTVTIVLSVVMCVVFIVYAFGLKEDSAWGRFLMWKVALTAIDSFPFSGVGWQRVPGMYGMAQETYFMSGEANPIEIYVAGAPKTVFNEYLQIAVAYGWGWSLLIIVMLLVSFLASLHSHRYGVAGSVAAVAVIMFSSYPLQFPVSVIAICLILFAGLSCSRNNVLRLSGGAVILGGMIFILSHCRPYEVKEQFKLGMAYHRAGKWSESNKVMKGLLPYTSDAMLLNVIAKNFASLGLTDSSEYYLRRSIHRCPNRLYPHYLLMKMYIDKENPDTPAALKEAYVLLEQKEKVSSSAVEEMRLEAKDIIKRYRMTE